MRITTLKAYLALAKPRLTFFVTLSAVFSYFIGENPFDALILIYLILGGFFIAAGAGAFNQILEIPQDSRMNRTANRPLVRGLISSRLAIFVAIIYVLLGMFFLYQIDFLVFVFGTLSFVLYAFVYTPLKKYSTWAVLVGAIPGAFPSILGYVANTHHFDLIAGILFFVQFMWQFPHFWAIAWVTQEDYQKAGYDLLPLSGGKTSENAFVILMYTFMLIPASLLLWIFPEHAPLLSNSLAIGVALVGLFFFYFAIQLYLQPSDKKAKYLMFASFVYLPLVQIIYIFHRL